MATDLPEPGPFDLVMYDCFRYISLGCNKPVDCEHIEYQQQDTRDGCPFQANYAMKFGIEMQMGWNERREKDREERAAKMGNPAVQKAKAVFRAITPSAMR